MPAGSDEYFVAVDRAIRSIAGAAHGAVDTVTAALTSLKSSVAANNEIFVKFAGTPHYRTLLRALLQNVFSEWLPCFTPRERRELFDCYFSPAPSIRPQTTFVVVDVVVTSLREIVSALDRRQVGDFLATLLHGVGDLVEGVWHQLAAEQKTQGHSSSRQAGRRNSFKRDLQRLCSLPERVSNALQGADVGPLAPGTFFRGTPHLSPIVAHESCLWARHWTFQVPV